MKSYCQCFELWYKFNEFIVGNGGVRVTSNFNVTKQEGTSSRGNICHIKIVNVYSIRKHKEDIEVFMDDLREIGCIECAVAECVCNAKTIPALSGCDSPTPVQTLTSFSDLMGILFGMQYVALCRVSIEKEESTQFSTTAGSQASHKVLVERSKPNIHYGILVNGLANLKGTLLVDTQNKITPHVGHSHVAHSVSSRMIGGNSSSYSARLSSVVDSSNRTNCSDSQEGLTAFQKLCKSWLTVVGRITLSRRSPQPSTAQLALTTKKTSVAIGVGGSVSHSFSTTTLNNHHITQMPQPSSGCHAANESSAETSKLHMGVKLRSSLPVRSSRGLQALQRQFRAGSLHVVESFVGDCPQVIPRTKNDFLQTIRQSRKLDSISFDNSSSNSGLDLSASLVISFSGGDSDNTALQQSSNSLFITSTQFTGSHHNSNQCSENDATEQQPPISPDVSRLLAFECFLSNNTIPVGLNSSTMPIVQNQQNPQHLHVAASIVSAPTSRNASSVLVERNARQSEETTGAQVHSDLVASSPNNNDSTLAAADSASVTSSSLLMTRRDLVVAANKGEQDERVAADRSASLSEYQTALSKLPIFIGSLISDCVLWRLTHPVACALQLVQQLMSLSTLDAETMLSKLAKVKPPHDERSRNRISKYAFSSRKPNGNSSKGNQRTVTKTTENNRGTSNRHGGSVSDKWLLCDAIVAHLCNHLFSMLNRIKIGGRSEKAAAYSALCVVLMVFPTQYYFDVLRHSSGSNLYKSCVDDGCAAGAGVLKKLKSFASYASTFETAISKCKLALGSWCLGDSDKHWILALPGDNSSDSVENTVPTKHSTNGTNTRTSCDAVAVPMTHSTPTCPSMQVLVDFLKASYASYTALYEHIEESIRMQDAAQLLLDTPVKVARPAKKARRSSCCEGKLNREGEDAELTTGTGVASDLGGALHNVAVRDAVLNTVTAAVAGCTVNSMGSLMGSNAENTTSSATSVAALTRTKTRLKRTNSILGERNFSCRRYVSNRLNMGEQKRVSVANPASITSAHHKVASSLLHHTKSSSNDTSDSNNCKSVTSQHIKNSLHSFFPVYDSPISQGSIHYCGDGVTSVTDTPLEQQTREYRQECPTPAAKSGRSGSSGCMTSKFLSSVYRVEPQQLFFGSLRSKRDVDAEEKANQRLHFTDDVNSDANSFERSALFDDNETETEDHTEHMVRKKQTTEFLVSNCDGDNNKPDVKSVPKSAVSPSMFPSNMSVEVPTKVSLKMSARRPAKRLHGRGISHHEVDRRVASGSSDSIAVIDEERMTVREVPETGPIEKAVPQWQ